jgi:fucose permease
VSAQPRRAPVLLAYAGFVLVGVKNGAAGVLLVAQMNDYGVNRATIGLTFFAVSAGYVLASLSAGPLVSRFGFRIALAVAGGLAFLAGGLYLATRPPFVMFVLALVITGYGTGALESMLNAYLAAFDGATTLLNRLHAFFGVGALIGPVLAAWITSFASWRVVWLVMAAACVPLAAGFLAAYPGRAGVAAPETPGAPGTQVAPGVPDPAPRGLLASALRERGVLLGAAMLVVYVGLEISVGNWAFSYLVQARGLPATVAGYLVSGYWLGLTLGRFLISPVAARVGVSTAVMMYTCLAGVTATIVLAWLSPTALLAGLVLMPLGFFLGPVFPTTMASAPRLTRPALVPTAIGVMNAASVGGGSALPWLAGLLAQGTGMWTLLPFTAALSLLQVAAWRPVARRIRVPSSST